MNPSVNHLLLSIIESLDFKSLYDYDQQTWMSYLPNLDLSLIVFPKDGPVIFGNIIASRDYPNGVAATFDPNTFNVNSIRWRQDQGPSGCWDQASWTYEQFLDLLPGQAGLNFISPYPASLFKLLIGVEVMIWVESGHLSLNQIVTYSDAQAQTERQTLQVWLEAMLQLSDDRATFALIQQLHHLGVIQSQEQYPHQPCEQRYHRIEVYNKLNQRMAELGLSTLQVHQTRACDGSFYNQAGAGVGHLHMTSWDTARLLWLLDPTAPPPLWTLPDPHWLSSSSKHFLIDHLLGQQGFHDTLSTTALCGTPYVRPGIPALMPECWIAPDGSVALKDNELVQTYSHNVRPCNDLAEVTFAHKTGLTTNYASDAGVVKGISARGHHRHYIISFFSNLGYRYTDHWISGELKYASGFERTIWYPQVIADLGHLIDQGVKRLWGA